MDKVRKGDKEEKAFKCVFCKTAWVIARMYKTKDEEVWVHNCEKCDCQFEDVFGDGDFYPVD